jgi:hypothetical protein
MRYAPWTPFLLLVVLVSTACSSVTDELGESGLAGDWCTLRALGAGGLPVEEAAWVGGQLGHSGSQVSGTGQVKRADDDQLWPSRFRGDIIGERLLMEVTPLGEAQEDAPVLELDLEIRGRNDLVGTVTGDPGLLGDITLVRLGPRCFAD